MLNLEQKKAVEILDRPVIVVAGPGTGKTALICEKINYLFENGHKEDEILAITFTQKAAEEMSSRVEEKTKKIFTAKTFHSFALEIIESYPQEFSQLDLNYRLIEEFDSYIFFLENLDKFNLTSIQLKNNFQSIAYDIQAAVLKLKEFGIKNETIDKINFDNNLCRNEVKKAYVLYEKYKLDNNYLDFSDILIYLYDALKNNFKFAQEIREKYSYILVDEFQDTNKIQIEILKLIVNLNGDNIIIVGDKKQSIYSFRGVFEENFEEFKTNFENYELIYLHENYRAQRQILNAINSLTLSIGSSKEELLKQNVIGDGEINLIESSSEESQVKYIIDRISEIKKNTPKATIGILSRRRSELRDISFKLKEQKIKHNSLQVMSFFNQYIIKELILILKVINSPYDTNNEFFMYLQNQDLRFETIKFISRKASQKEKSIFRVLEEENLSEYETEKIYLKELKEVLNYLIELKKTGVSVFKLVYEVIAKFNFYQKCILFENKENVMLLNKFIDISDKFSRVYRDSSLNRFLGVCEMSKGVDFNFDDESENLSDISLLTIHQAKGKEFDYVFMVYLNDRKFPSQYQQNRFKCEFDLSREKFIEEEKRVFFVGISRAKIGLDLIYVKRYSDNKFDSKPSEFLLDLNLYRKIYDEKLGFAKLNSNEQIKIEIISKINSLLLSGQFDEAKKQMDLMKSLFSKKDLTSFLNPELNKSVSEYNLRKQKDKIDSVYINPETQTYSVSQLKTYESCPRKYMYNYVYKIPTASKHFFDFGTSVHSVLENLLPLFETNSSESLYAIGISNLHKNWISKGYENVIQEKEYFEKGLDVIKQFIDREFELRKGRVSIALEKEFLITVEGKKILGYIDRIDRLNSGDYEIIDYKTSNSMETTASLSENLQLYVYAIALKELYDKYPKKVGLWYLIHDKLMQVEIDLRNIDMIKLKIKELAEGIENNKFNPSPSFFNCSYCDFSNICEFSSKK